MVICARIESITAIATQHKNYVDVAKNVAALTYKRIFRLTGSDSRLYLRGFPWYCRLA